MRLNSHYIGDLDVQGTGMPQEKSGQLTITIFYGLSTVKLMAHPSTHATVQMCVFVLMLIRYGTLMFKALAHYRNNVGLKIVTMITRP